MKQNSLDSFPRPPSNTLAAPKSVQPKRTTQTQTTTTTTTAHKSKALDLLVNDLAEYIANDEPTTKPKPKPKPKPSSSKTPKKLAWAFADGMSCSSEYAVSNVALDDDWEHSHVDPLDAIEGTAFQTKKQLPRTPLAHEKTRNPPSTVSSPMSTPSSTTLRVL